MIELPWWGFGLTLLAAAIVGILIFCCVVVLWPDGSEPVSEVRAKRRRAVYLDWCIRNRWCPEHDRPDHDGHVLLVDVEPYLRPCPGSITRRAVPERRPSTSVEVEWLSHQLLLERRARAAVRYPLTVPADIPD